jgi:aryl-alcohol dehydrogenase (NADP+)
MPLSLAAWQPADYKKFHEMGGFHIFEFDAIGEEAGMEQRVLGRTGLYVSAIGLGAGSFGGINETPEAECIRIAHCAFDGGVTLIDTADLYSKGESEIITGKAIAGRRDKVILSSKCGARMAEGYLQIGGSRRWIHRAVENSLKRLNTDYIDLFQLHRPDYSTDILETIDTFNDLIRAGKIRYFGTSNFSAEELVEASLRADMRNLIGPHSEQGPYSIFNRHVEGNVLPVCQKFGMGFMAYSPLDNGFLAGKYRHGKIKEASARQKLMPSAVYDLSQPHNVRRLDAVEQLVVLAQEMGVELSHLAMAFTLAHPAVTTSLIGGSKIEYIQQYLAGKDVRLSHEVLDRIDAIAPPGGSFSAPILSLPPALTNSRLRRR